jgi:hypothetical protein
VVSARSSETVILLVILLDNRHAGRGIPVDASGLYSRSATVRTGGPASPTRKRSHRAGERASRRSRPRTALALLPPRRLSLPDPRGGRATIRASAWCHCVWSVWQCAAPAPSEFAAVTIAHRADMSGPLPAEALNRPQAQRPRGMSTAKRLMTSGHCTARYCQFAKGQPELGSPYPRTRRYLGVQHVGSFDIHS